MMVTKWVGVALTALTVVALAGCGSDSTEASSETTVAAAAGAAAPVEQLTPEAGAQLLADRAGAITVIDVRTPDEFAGGHLADAVNIDVEAADFDAQVQALDPTKAYAVYCHSGRRSALAAARLVELGFTDVHDLGGIEAWVAAGNPVVTG